MLFLTFLAVPVQYYWVHDPVVRDVRHLHPGLHVPRCCPWTLVLARETTGFVASAAQIHWGLMAFVFGLSHLAYLLQLAGAARAGRDGRTLLLFLVFVVELSDVLQYCWGKTPGPPQGACPRSAPTRPGRGCVGGVAARWRCWPCRCAS